MADRKPREPEDHEYTGTGTTRSSDSTHTPREGASADTTDVDPAIISGATTSSDPADVSGLAINRSGSGGSGDEANDDMDGSEPPAA